LPLAWILVAETMRFFGTPDSQLDLRGRSPLGPAFAIAVTVLCAVALTRCGGGSSAMTPPPPGDQNVACNPGNTGSVTNPALPGLYPLSPGPAGTFFGINANGLKDPWPTTGVPLTSWRSLGASVKWADINTDSGVYDFSRLDQWLTKAKTGNTDVMFTAYATPSWDSSRGKNSVSPNACCAFEMQNGPGICDPPVDLNCDGTGTDQTFIDFLVALIQHVGPGTIKYWELWNEPNIPSEWNGEADCVNSGVAHPGNVMLARMAKDLKTTVAALDPNAKFTTPAATDGSKAGDWLGRYLSETNGGSYADINAFHGYISTGGCPSDCPVAEAVGDEIDHLNSLLPASAKGKPLFDTEGYWGTAKNPDGTRTTGITDPDQQASFVARYYLIQMWKQVAKFYWWNWDIALETAFYNSTNHLLTAPGNAYVRIVQWTDGGASKIGPCATNPSVATQWTCTITAASGPASVAIWDTSQPCNAGTCSTTNVDLQAIGLGSFNAYQDLLGNTTSISNGTVPVGLRPVLLIHH
jgi:hypothetical protein